jgi:prepilin-type N-terminal cleavage/methylation domain-containing protein
MKKRHASSRGFSLIELLVVTSIIGLLASVTLGAVNRGQVKARDVSRVSEMQSITKALELYYISHQRYPFPDVDGCGWDIGNATHPMFFNAGMNSNFAGSKPPVDLWKSGECDGYRYFLYPAGSYGCPASRGPFYVLGVTDMESSGSPYQSSPGWSCPGRNWQDEFDWVTGAFEN